MSSQHVICVPEMRGVDDKGEGMSTYVVSFPRVLQSVRCLVPGCPVVSHNVGRLLEHFIFRNFQSRTAVVQEGMYLLPR